MYTDYCYHISVSSSALWHLAPIMHQSANQVRRGLPLVMQAEDLYTGQLRLSHTQSVYTGMQCNQLTLNLKSISESIHMLVILIQLLLFICAYKMLSKT